MNRIQMRIGLLSINQTANDRPEHFISKVLANQICLERRYTPEVKKSIQTGVWISNCLIHLQTKESIREIKDRFKKTKLAVVPIPRILPPASSYDCLAAPYPVRDMSSYSVRSLREVWGCDQIQWQKRIGI